MLYLPMHFWERTITRQQARQNKADISKTKWLDANFEGFDWVDAPIYCQQFADDCRNDYYQVGQGFGPVIRLESDHRIVIVIILETTDSVPVFIRAEKNS